MCMGIGSAVYVVNTKFAISLIQYNIKKNNLKLEQILGQQIQYERFYRNNSNFEFTFYKRRKPNMFRLMFPRKIFHCRKLQIYTETKQYSIMKRTI